MNINRYYVMTYDNLFSKLDRSENRCIIEASLTKGIMMLQIFAALREISYVGMTAKEAELAMLAQCRIVDSNASGASSQSPLDILTSAWGKPVYIEVKSTKGKKWTFNDSPPCKSYQGIPVYYAFVHRHRELLYLIPGSIISNWTKERWDEVKKDIFKLGKIEQELHAGAFTDGCDMTLRRRLAAASLTIEQIENKVKGLGFSIHPKFCIMETLAA